MKRFKEYLQDNIKDLTKMGEDALTELGRKNLNASIALLEYVNILFPEPKSDAYDSFVAYIDGEIETLKLKKESELDFNSEDESALAIYETCKEMYLRFAKKS